jgi:hypothetical protein
MGEYKSSQLDIPQMVALSDKVVRMDPMMMGGMGGMMGGMGGMMGGMGGYG